MNTRDLTAVVLIILGVLLLAPLLMSLGGFGMMGPGMWGGGVMGLVFLVILVGVLVALLQRRNVDLGRLLSGQSEKRPIDIAKERYARGDITREQFEQLRADLENGSAHTHEAGGHVDHSHGHCGH